MHSISQFHQSYVLELCMSLCTSRMPAEQTLMLFL